MTNKDLKIQTPLTYHDSEDLYAMEINCHDNLNEKKMLGIFLKHQGASVFARARPHLFASNSKTRSVAEDRSSFLSKSISPSVSRSLKGSHRCSFIIRGVPSYWRRVIVQPETLWDSGKNLFIIAGLQDFVGYHGYTRSEYSPARFFIVFGYGHGYGSSPWVHVDANKSLNTPLYREVKVGNWKRVAELANMKLYRSTRVQLKAPERLVDIHVKLEEATEDKEPVYVIQFGYLLR